MKVTGENRDRRRIGRNEMEIENGNEKKEIEMGGIEKGK